MKMQYPKRLPRRVPEGLLAQGRIQYDFKIRQLIWLDECIMFSKARNVCVAVFWDNLFRGNLPIPQERILGEWDGESTYLSYLFKRDSAWGRIIVGDGKGNFWLHVPEEIIREFEPE